MLDRSKCKKMLVWGHESAVKVPRIVIDVFKEGGCIAVESNTEEYFYAGKAYNTCEWEHCEEIKEPEWKAFTKNEQLEPYIDCWFRFKASIIKTKPIMVITENDNDDVSPLKLFDKWVELPHLFADYEMKVNGVWQPVGELK